MNLASQTPLQRLWPVPMGVHRFARAAEVNPILARVFNVMRVTDPAATVREADLIDGRLLLLAAGKKNKMLVRVAEGG